MADICGYLFLLGDYGICYTEAKGMFLFKKKPKGSLGVDIGTSSIKLVELAKEGERHRLENYAIFPLNRYSELSIPNEVAAEAIQRSVREADIGTKAAFLSVPSSLSFSTLVDLPDMPDKEIASAIPSEARKYVPVPISEVALDWSVLKPLSGVAGRQVLIIAVPKEIIKNYDQIVKLTELNFQSAESEVFSLKRALVGNDRSAVVLIDAGARSVGMSIVDEGYVRIVYSLSSGGLKIAQDIKSGLDLVIAEVKKVSDSYQRKYNRKIEKCILTGGNARLPGFVDSLRDRLSIDISLGNPFARIICPSGSEAVLKELHTILAVAIGLAMK